MGWCAFHEQRGMWGSDYCLKKDDYIDSDISKEYCRYDGKGCPIKENSSSSGGCYLTTACVGYKGLADDCVELSTLREFRDTYMKELPSGKEEVQEYYETAPGIVDAINSSDEAGCVYEAIYSDVIEPCVKLIQEGKNEEAYKKYKEMVADLKSKYTDC